MLISLSLSGIDSSTISEINSIIKKQLGDNITTELIQPPIDHHFDLSLGAEAASILSNAITVLAFYIYHKKSAQMDEKKDNLDAAQYRGKIVESSENETYLDVELPNGAICRLRSFSKKTTMITSSIKHR